MDQDEMDLADLVVSEAGIEIPETNESTETGVSEPVVEGPNAQAQEPDTTTQTTEQTQKEETKIEIPAFDWGAFLPDTTKVAAEPTPDEEGRIDPDQYKRHIIDSAKAELRAEQAFGEQITAQLSEAENILPEMKTNPALAGLVQSSAAAAALEGKPIDLIGAARTLSDILSAREAAGNANATVSIETQSAASIGGGSTTTAPDMTRGKALEARINAGDNDAVVELLDIWMQEGVV